MIIRKKPAFQIAVLSIACGLFLQSRCTPPAAPADAGPGPHVVEVAEPKDREFIPMTDSLNVPAEAPGYTLILPGEEPPRGLIVLFHSGRDTSHAGFEQRLYVDAVQRGVAALYVTTGHPFDFLFDSTAYERLDRYIGEAVRDHGLPAGRICFAGMSLAGTRALKFAEYCLAGKSRYSLRPRAVAVCDAPLDFLRFWRESTRSIQLELHPVSMNEARWVKAQLEGHLGGTAPEVPDAYRQYSPYVYGLEPDPRLALFDGVAVRAYTEPDVHWWMENRKKDYYGMNALDAAAFINDLHIRGNAEAELVTTRGRGHRPDGQRHPHSWSIVDNAELVEWLLNLPL